MSSAGVNYPVIKGALVSTENYIWNTADSLGKGASAVVYLGRHKAWGSLVAVKVFHERGNHAEYLREAELLRGLSHQNVIELKEIETILNTKKKVLVMEYCEGGSLHHMLDQPTNYYGLSEEEFLLVLSHVSKGMKFLRSRNVIHRDVKPGNIMRFISGDGFSVYKLTDFGAARNLDENESFQSLYGTEEYLHPGVYERAVLRLPTAQSFDARVDLWSIGVTFYHTATGQLPFQPYGGRNNRQTMFEIITQKDSGVISGIQAFDKGPIMWKRDLPETSPLSSGIKSIIIPILAGLMEPDPNRMLSYESLFRIIDNMDDKIVIDVFHYGRCEDLKIYADKTTTFTGLRDQIAGLTDIKAPDQILLVGGKLLEEVVDPVTQLQNYPPHLLHDSIYLFPKEMSESYRISKPEIPAFQDFPAHADMEADARLAHGCSARGELIKRYAEKVSKQQERLMDGLLCLRVYVETQLATTKASQEFMGHLMEECHMHFNTFFDLIRCLRQILATKSMHHRDIQRLDGILADKVIREVHRKASERMVDIEQYRDALIKKLDEIKAFSSSFDAHCKREQCLRKIQHHMTVIVGIHSRFRRDRSVKQQMTKHDENIHNFEKQRLEQHCVRIRSILNEHCLPKLEGLLRSCTQIVESLTRCLGRVNKIEKNINSVVSCAKLLSEKLIKLRELCKGELRSIESGFESAPSMEEESRTQENTATAEMAESAPMEVEHNSLGSGSDPIGVENPQGRSTVLKVDMQAMSSQAVDLIQNLESINRILESNQLLLRSLEEPLLSSGSLSRRLNTMYQTDLGGNT